MSNSHRSRSSARAAILFCLIGIIGDSHADPAAPDLDNRVTNEVTAIAKIWSISPRIQFDDGLQVAAKPDGSIEIGRGLLRTVLERAGPNAQSDTLRWLFAHELWHLVQFQRLGRNIYDRSDEYRRVIECQADLMAGYYIFDLNASDFKEKTEALTAVGNVPQSIALVSHGAQTHPSEADRRVAIQLGMSRAFYDHVEQIVGAEDVRRVRKNLADLLNFASADPIDEWAFAQCKKITHYGTSGTSLERLETKINWNKDGNPPIVNFNITYRNAGEKAIRVSLEILSASVPRNTPEQRALWQRQQALHQTVEIAPRATHSVSGTLYWYADDQFIPRLIYPLQQGSLVSIEESDAPPPPPRPVQLADGISPEAAKFGTSLLRIAGDAPNNFINIRAPGCWGDLNIRFCSSTVDVAGAQKTEVWVERNGSATVEIDLCDKVTKSEAQASYDRFVQNIRSLWPTTVLREKTSRRSGLPYVELQLTDRADLSVDLRASDDKYSVSMTITPVN